MSSAPSSVREEYQKAFAFVQLGVHGRADHDSTMAPFMIPDLTADAPEGGTELRATNELLKRVPLAPELRRVYQVIASPSCELVFGSWILMSLQKVCDRYELLRDQHGQSRAIDFAFIYAGMGHCTVCSYDPEENQVYYRADGGGNGYEREDHFSFACRYVPRADECHPLEHWFTVARQSVAIAKGHAEPGGGGDNEAFSLPLVPHKYGQ